jgi:hypothetical protein
VRREGQALERARELLGGEHRVLPNRRHQEQAGRRVVDRARRPFEPCPHRLEHALDVRHQIGKVQEHALPRDARQTEERSPRRAAQRPSEESCLPGAREKTQPRDEPAVEECRHALRMAEELDGIQTRRRIDDELDEAGVALGPFGDADGGEHVGRRRETTGERDVERVAKEAPERLGLRARLVGPTTQALFGPEQRRMEVARARNQALLIFEGQTKRGLQPARRVDAEQPDTRAATRERRSVGGGERRLADAPCAEHHMQAGRHASPTPGQASSASDTAYTTSRGDPIPARTRWSSKVMVP